MSSTNNFYSNKPPQYRGVENETASFYGPYGGGKSGGQQQARTSIAAPGGAPRSANSGSSISNTAGGVGGSSAGEDWFNPTSGLKSSTTSSNVGRGYAAPYSATSGITFSGHPQETVPPYYTPAASSSNSASVGMHFASASEASAGMMDLSGPMGSSHQPMSKSSSNTNRSSMLFQSQDELSFENEPPLMEELGINLPQIIQKTKAVIFPVGTTSSIDAHLMDDDDLAGPLVYALLLGGELLLSAKISFGYIYGFGLFDCFAMTLIINLMSPKAEGVSLWRVTSILGYCLLPVNFLAALNCVLFLKYRGLLGLSLAAISVLWCTVASTRLFERSCDMRNQRYLIAYPIALLYTSFVMITIF